jgi:NADH-quinone oxidoreductase subunit L
MLGIGGILAYFTGSLDYATVFAQGARAAPSIELMSPAATGWPADHVICICLFIGAMGKSAQVPLHVWLPDSMEGPTPISALIHAATMVTAGIFMVARMSPLFELSDTALSFVWSSARSPRCSWASSASSRTTSSASSPIRRCRSSAT